MFQGKRMVVFGCGYLGTRVAHQAAEAGLEVTALTRNAVQAHELRETSLFHVVEAELDGTDWHGAIDPHQDIVLNCVGSAGGGVKGYRKSYLDGMRSIVKWAERGRVETMIFTSSTRVYERNDGGVATETDSPEGRSERARILHEAEMLLAWAPPSAVGRRFILRLGGIYGPGRCRLLDYALGGVPESEDDKAYLNSIHVDDAVQAIWAAAGASEDISGGIFNIVDGNPLPKREVLEYLRTRFAKRATNLSEQETEGTRSRSSRGRRPNRQVSNRKARALLGWQPTYPDCRTGYELLYKSSRIGGVPTAPEQG